MFSQVCIPPCPPRGSPRVVPGWTPRRDHQGWSPNMLRHGRPHKGGSPRGYTKRAPERGSQKGVPEMVVRKGGLPMVWSLGGAP